MEEALMCLEPTLDVVTKTLMQWMEVMYDGQRREETGLCGAVILRSNNIMDEEMDDGRWDGGWG
eukprot:scaffold1831_cov39-Cyclotella_meneghiniana.AAC.1